ncbi:MAG: chemotaxis protein CheW [Proteobacteria bacterium]|nr:chemotaxis protein CheW [Pseudomonadota bacterium]
MIENKTIKLDEDLLSFIVESREILDDVEPHLIGLGQRLEKNIPPDEETVNFIFRGFHTIKGTAAFYHLDNVVSVAHKAETLLEYFRSGKETINGSCTDILCQACDVMGFLFNKIESAGSEMDHEDKVKSIIHRLNGRIEVFKKKKVVETSSSSMDYEGFSRGEDRNSKRVSESDVTYGEIGRSTQLFIAEFRSLVHGIEEICVGRTLTGDDRSKMKEILQMMMDGALFLGFDQLGHHVDIIVASLEKKLWADDQQGMVDHDDFNHVFDDLLTTVNRIEQTGWDIPIVSGHGGQDDDPLVLSLSENGKDDRDATPGSRGSWRSLSPPMKDLFFHEAFQCMEHLEKHLNFLREERLNRTWQTEIKNAFHLIKGSSGMAGHNDLELIAHNAEECFEAVLDDRIILDEWDLKALRHVVLEMKETLDGLKKGQSRILFKKAALIHMINQIRSGLSCDEKEDAIHLPDISRDNRQKGGEADKQDGVLEGKEDGGSFRFPLFEADMHSEPERSLIKDEQGRERGLLWGGERRKSERKDIRVSIEKLDELMNLVGELVLAENMVSNNPDIKDRELENFEKARDHLRKIIRDLQDVALAVRMVPISSVFRKMIRQVHDLSMKSGKRVSLKIIGEDTEIDKTAAEMISDPLVHLVRNAIDHGIQKNSAGDDGAVDGRIVIEARHEGGEILVIVRDNGKGLDTEKIFNKAVASGIVKQNQSEMSRQDIHNLIFHPGFSTCDTVTPLSGRGVGMDVVKQNMEKIKGQVHVFSQPFRGTTFVMRIPLTLSIIDGMLVRVGMASYTIPLLSIRETVQVNEERVIQIMDGQEMINLRGHLIPVIRLDHMYGLEAKTREMHEGLLVVFEHHKEMAALFIDQIIGEQQTVIKGLSGYMENVEGISGCTILGDGEVSLILDVAGLLQKARFSEGKPRSKVI